MTSTFTHRMAAGLIALLLLAAGCSDDSSDGSASDDSTPPASAPEGAEAADESLEPVVIGFQSQEEELLSYVEARYAAEATVGYINAELGGVEGHPVELEVCTSGDGPEGAVACGQDFVNDDAVLAAAVSSNYPTEVVAVTGPAELPVLGVAITIEDWQTEFEWSLDAGFTGLTQGPTVFAAEELEAETVTIVCLDDPFYLEACEDTQDLAEDQGLEVLGITSVGLEEADYSGVVTLSEAADADAVLAFVDAAQCPPLSESLTSLGVDTPVLTFDSCALEDTLEGDVLDGWYVFGVGALPVDPATASPEILEGQRILELYGSDDATPYGVAGWAMASVLAIYDSMVSVGYDNLTRPALNEAIGTHSSDLGWFAPTDCGNPPEGFPGACTQTVVALQVNGEQLEYAGQVPIDFAAASGG